MANRRRRASSEGSLELAGPPGPADGAWDLLAPYLTDDRRGRLMQVLASRTDRLILVLDRPYDPHNLSAILRTADAFGVQSVILTGSCPDGLNPQVALGAQRWLTVTREEGARECMGRLRASGYTVAAAVLSTDAVTPEAFEPSGPVALVLGNEHDGLGPDWTEGADVRLRISLCGFAQSLNVSVAAGVLVSVLLSKPALSRRGLPEELARRLADRWIVRSVPHGERILARLRSGKAPPDE